MKLRLERVTNNGKATLGVMFLDDVFECFTLEDVPREVKLAGETRIAAETYKIKLRSEGGMTKKYAQKFPDIHEGMLWLQNVPNFEWVYLHIGNHAGHTDGCILVGQTATAEPQYSVGRSTAAYEALYRKIRDEARGEEMLIEIIDRDGD